jgi:RNA polymerase sigma-70 factor (ECF subfamily)
MVNEYETISPEQLARQSKAGCQDSFEQLVRHYADRIYHFLFQMVGNHADAEDLAQETFVKAFRSIGRFDPAYSFTTWLYAIARHTAINHYRRSRTFEPLLAEEESSVPSPAAQAEQGEANRSLWELARALKPKQYEALWLRYGEGFSVVEVARVMQTNQIHVKVLLHRARHKLGQQLERHPDTFEGRRIL